MSKITRGNSACLGCDESEHYKTFLSEMLSYGWTKAEADETWSEMDHIDRAHPDLAECPCPIKPDNGTAAQCVARGHCGCVHGSVAKAREAKP